MRAVVLSGGGPLAVAWETGLLAGLARQGVRLSDADMLFGTSAGAIVGAQVASGVDPEALFDAIQAEARGTLPAGASTPPPPGAMAKLPELFAKAQAAGDDDPRARIEVGAYALSAGTEPMARYVARVAAGLRSRQWPGSPRFASMAVNAVTGAVAVLDRDSGADFGQAVAASCSLPGITPAVVIGDQPYLDGGLRSTANADLARGFQSVLVVAYQPPGAAGERVRARLDQQVRTLVDDGARVHVIAPDDASLESLGPPPGDVTRRPEIARAAVAQASSIGDLVRRFWLR